MKHLFNALKEHWQIYVGLLLGLIIGLLVGVGFADWKSLVKGFDSKVTDWISSLSTLFGVLIAANGIHSWKKQKEPEVIAGVIESIAALHSSINDLTKKYEKKLLEIKDKDKEKNKTDQNMRELIHNGLYDLLTPYSKLKSYIVQYKILSTKTDNLSPIFSNIKNEFDEIFYSSAIYRKFNDLSSKEKSTSEKAIREIKKTKTHKEQIELLKNISKNLNKIKENINI